MTIDQLRNSEKNLPCCIGNCSHPTIAVLVYVVKHPITHLPDENKREPICFYHATMELNKWWELQYAPNNL
jgi:hypothetical protein